MLIRLLTAFFSDYTVSLFPEPESAPVTPPIPWFIWAGFGGIVLLAVAAVIVTVLVSKKVKKARAAKLRAAQSNEEKSGEQ